MPPLDRKKSNPLAAKYRATGRFTPECAEGPILQRLAEIR